MGFNALEKKKHYTNMTLELDMIKSAEDLSKRVNEFLWFISITAKIVKEGTYFYRFDQTKL